MTDNSWNIGMNGLSWFVNFTLQKIGGRKGAKS